MSAWESNTRLTGTILDNIVQDRKKFLKIQKSEFPLKDLELAFASSDQKLRSPQNFGDRLRNGSENTPESAKIRLIGEIKRASPSKGDFNIDLVSSEQAHVYRDVGCAAVSVLTEGKYFKGSIGDLVDVSNLFSGEINSPGILRKDFIFDYFQVLESRLMGADALLLIVAILEEEYLKFLLDQTRSLGMEALVEVHTEQELEVALRVDAKIIGINNRNLKDFSEDLSTFEYLSSFCPSDKILVAERAIRSRLDADRMLKAGADAMLVGESLVRSTEVRHFAHQLMLTED
jgi:indole-3-glycerol phosphate synthase